MVLVPVIRPQDLATKGTGTLAPAQEGDQIIKGTNTLFKEQVQPRDLLAISKSVMLPVLEVISDTEIKLKTPLTKEAAAILNQQQGVSFKVTPHVDQAQLFENVHKQLAVGDSILIFPEGGSHDRSELLPLKGKRLH
jgi:glycerol-3-phosphate O-acyltransferase/dihydroxyacetone phosphate acyltransferase